MKEIIDIIAKPLAIIDIVEEMERRRGCHVNYNWVAHQVDLLIESGSVKRIDNGSERDTYQSCTKEDHVKRSRIPEEQVSG